MTTDRFFIHYINGKCTNQHIGIHKIGEVPRFIAEFCQLAHADRYTGHCFRRSSATLASNSGATMQMIKQLGRWRSDAIAEGYIENSLHNREIIFNKVVQQNETTISNTLEFPTTTHLKSAALISGLSEPELATVYQPINATSNIPEHVVSAPLTSTIFPHKVNQLWMLI